MDNIKITIGHGLYCASVKRVFSTGSYLLLYILEWIKKLKNWYFYIIIRLYMHVIEKISSRRYSWEVLFSWIFKGIIIKFNNWQISKCIPKSSFNMYLKKYHDNGIKKEWNIRPLIIKYFYIVKFIFFFENVIY